MSTNSSEYWVNHFQQNAKFQRIDWEIAPQLQTKEKHTILRSLQAWQLGETSEGLHLLHAAKKYANKTNDFIYPIAVELFIKEEQKHGNNLGKYLDLIGEKRIEKDWGDTLFRKVRYFNTNMETWTLAVITVESAAQLFYQSLKDATQCPLLKQICEDILIDEEQHIHFQTERMRTVCSTKTAASRLLRFWMYKAFYFSTALLVWFGHRAVFKAGGYGFWGYWGEMSVKFSNTLGKARLLANSFTFHQIDKNACAGPLAMERS
jgi:bacterioferritin (cytochrome b1)